MALSSALLIGHAAVRIGQRLTASIMEAGKAFCPPEARATYPVAVIKKNRRWFGRIIAGAYGFIGSGWLMIDELWVAEAYRAQGLGTQLLHDIEQLAIAQGCHSAYLWTMSFEAPAFYHKHGYSEFVRLERCAGPHQRLGFRKQLVKEVQE